ncbi:UDP-N-acetylmuramoyl-tripeptide--D-alanyl-D-alanine ligase [soil metagenome]
MKKAAKAFVVTILAWQVRRLRKRNNFKIVAVVGSIGKTSTKLAIARVLSGSLKVRYQSGNYNDIVSVPLVFFGSNLPSLLNPFAWLGIFLKNEQIISNAYPYDVVVVELGTDGPGQISAFKKYIKSDISVITALTPEHMQYFSNLQSVADEELSVGEYSEKIIMNADLCPKELTGGMQASYLTYGLHKDATYVMKEIIFTNEGSRFALQKDRTQWLKASHTSFSEPQLYSLLAAASVSDLLGISPQKIEQGFDNIEPVAGRMQKLKGVHNSTIIDDTYNASPDAVQAALDTLYRLNAPQKIALLGNMNELGEFSKDSHTEIGLYCDPRQLDLVVTLGTEANSYLADAAEKQGCNVIRVRTPYEAGALINEKLEEGGIVLAKGSQNGVYSEEAVKLFLADPKDESKLVRQSPRWLKIKQKQFGVYERKK